VCGRKHKNSSENLARERVTIVSHRIVCEWDWDRTRDSVEGKCDIVRDGTAGRDGGEYRIVSYRIVSALLCAGCVT
jgi:hypothetical protein